jgi:hypothetical protein
MSHTTCVSPVSDSLRSPRRPRQTCGMKSSQAFRRLSRLSMSRRVSCTNACTNQSSRSRSSGHLDSLGSRLAARMGQPLAGPGRTVWPGCRAAGSAAHIPCGSNQAQMARSAAGTLILCRIPHRRPAPWRGGRGSRSRTSAQGDAIDAVAASWTMPGGDGGSARPWPLDADRD